MQVNTKELDEQLNSMIVKGRAMEAFEEFYDDDVVMEEPRTGVRRGKQANRRFEKEFFETVEKVHAVELVSAACEDEDSFSEWKWDISFKDGNRVNMEEVAHRQWRDGQVVREKFYYATQDQ